MTKYIFANWKENRNLPETQTELTKLGELLSGRDLSQRQLVLLPPVVFLISVSEQIARSSLPFGLGVQDISTYEEGSFTGEVSARMVKDFASFSLVGHSERRRLFVETAEVVNGKVALCLKFGLTPVICVRSREDLEAIDWNLDAGKLFVAFEDPQLIGGEEVEDLIKIIEFSKLVQSLTPAEVRFIYGGGVSPRTARPLLSSPEIDGLLVGHHSLKAESLAEIILP